MRSKTGDIRERVREQTMNFLEESERPMFNVRSPRGSIANVLTSCDGLLESSSLNDSWESSFSWTSGFGSAVASDCILVVLLAVCEGKVYSVSWYYKAR